MLDRRFDDLSRRLARQADVTATRRRVLGAGAAGSVAALLAGRRAALAQDATPPPTPRPGIRPPGGPSVRQKAFDLAYDPAAIFAFVTAEVGYDPYAGALRGATGALRGLAGNSVDQALLLAALLNEGLVKTRFAIGTLDDAGAGRLLDAAGMSLGEARSHLAAVNRLLTPEEGAPVPPPLTPEQQRIVDELPRRADALLAAAAAQLTAGRDLLGGALEAAGVELPTPAFALPESERARHVWVQYAAGPEWRDLDASVPGAAMDTAYAELIETVDELPEELYHRVRFRVIGERATAGQLEPTELLSYEARGSDLVTQPVTLMHPRPESLRAVGQTIEGSLEGTTQYIPHLVLGSADAVVATERVTLGAGGGVLDVLGSGDGVDGEMVAEWLEITVLSPDAPARVVTRVVFDRLDPAARASGTFDPAALAPIELTEFEGSRMFLPLEAIWSIVTAGGPTPLSLLQQDRSIDDFQADLAAIVTAYHNARDGLALGVAADGGQRYLLDAPNLTAFRLTPLAISADVGRARVEIDLLHQSFALAPLDGAAPDPQALLVAGVLSQVTERLLLERDTGGLIEEPPMPVVNVGRVFEAAAAAGVPVLTLRPGTPLPADFEASPRARAGIAAALDAGLVLVVPAGPVEIAGEPLTGWWQIDPATGATTDLMETGAGAASVDYGLMLQTIARNAIYYFSRLGFCAYTVFTLSALIGLDAGYAGAVAATSGGGISPGAAMGAAVLGGATVGTVGTMALACG